jgi:hypothetical protein
MASSQEVERRASRMKDSSAGAALLQWGTKTTALAYVCAAARRVVFFNDL